MSLISFFKDPLIEFLTTEEHLNVLIPPAPANKFVPEWYKAIPPYSTSRRDHKGAHAMSAKKCLPMLDAMTYGYIIPLAGDVHIRSNDDASLIDITQNPYVKLTEEHHVEQVGPKFPFPKHHLIKFINHFVIKTPPGYSCLFTAPINHLETRFITLGAIVETDMYDRPINFPTCWLATNYDDILPAGTPIIQCIPFKRSSTIDKSEVRSFTDNELKKNNTLMNKQNNQTSYYVNNIRVKK
jgi:Family of unknown function (DUF6065)